MYMYVGCFKENVQSCGSHTRAMTIICCSLSFCRMSRFALILSMNGYWQKLNLQHTTRSVWITNLRCQYMYNAHNICTCTCSTSTRALWRHDVRLPRMRGRILPGVVLCHQVQVVQRLVVELGERQNRWMTQIVRRVWNRPIFFVNASLTNRSPFSIQRYSYAKSFNVKKEKINYFIV